MGISKTFLEFKNNDKEILIALIGSSETDKNKVYENLYNIKNNTSINNQSLTNIHVEYNNNEYIFVNLPTVNTLFNLPKQKSITRDFLCFANPYCILFVCNEDSLESDLNLLFQILDLSISTVILMNLNNNSILDKKILESELNLPIIYSSNGDFNISMLLKVLNELSLNKCTYNNSHLLYECNIESVVSSFKNELEESNKTISSRWLALRLIDHDDSFLKAVNMYLDEQSIDNINNIQEVFPKTLDVNRVRNNFLSRRYESVINVKNKVYYKKSDNNNKGNYFLKNSPRKSVITHIYMLLLIIVALLLF